MTLTGRTDDSQKLQRIAQRQRNKSLARMERRIADRSELAKGAKQKGKELADLPD